MITAKISIKTTEWDMNYSDTIEKIRRLAQGEDVCDDALCQLLLDSGCYYLLSKSEKYASKRMIQVAMNSVVVSQRYKVCKEVFEKLSDIPYAHIKGAALSERIYGNPAYRMSGDIDLLVAPEYSDKVKSVLLENGFVQGRLSGDKIVPYSRRELIYQKSFSHQLAQFIKATGSNICPFVCVDVNLDIVWGEGDFSVDMSDFAGNMLHTEDCLINGIALRRLKPVYEFISLCMHHYKDMNSIYLIADRGFSLSEYCDIYFYLVNVAPDADELAKTAAKYGVSKYIYYCAYYANEIFRDERIRRYIEKSESETAKKLIDCYGLNESERKIWDVPFYERLLDNGFQERFFDSLSAEDKKKVQINREMM